MSHRITPVEAEGTHVPTLWDEAAATLLDLDEAADLSSFDEEVEMADAMLEAQSEQTDEMADFEFAGPLIL